MEAAPPSRRRRSIAAAAAGLAVAMVVGGGLVWFTSPSVSDLPLRVETIARAAGGLPLAPAQVPPALTRAVVAAEDERFQTHPGLDPIGLVRAGVDDALGACLCEGGSTVTQQLGKVVYYGGDDRFARKIPGMMTALKIEAAYSKPEIMADYLTVVYTGNGLVGARAAACAYFQRPLATVDAAQAAQIAGSIQGPARYDPRIHPGLAEARRAYVLERMVELGFLTPAQVAAARAEPVLSAGPGC